MEIQSFLQIAIVGVFLSFVIELVTLKIHKPVVTKIITVALALATAGVFVWIKNTAYFQTVITVLGTASIVYGFLLNKKTE